VLVIIDIPVIRDLAITTCVGVSVLVFTKLVLIPVTLSYIGVSESAARRAVEEESGTVAPRTVIGRLWARLDVLTERNWAIGMISVAVLITAVSTVVMKDLRIGDLDSGAPELRPSPATTRTTPTSPPTTACPATSSWSS
jgi:predicted RND superfamily exporter protein